MDSCRTKTCIKTVILIIATIYCHAEYAKYRIFILVENPTLPDHQYLYLPIQMISFLAFCIQEFMNFGHDRKERNFVKSKAASATRPTTCFETFPLPQPTKKQEKAIAAAAKELDELRNRWLNPPEWTRTEILEFPGSVAGPWARYVDPKTVRPHAKGEGGIGTVRWPRLVPKDPDCRRALKKRTLTNLYNQRPQWLANAHAHLDAAVVAAYGWEANLSDEEILERLLKLNLERSNT